jgi:hypothetical protein
MAENLDLNINVNTSGADSSVGSLKKQLREAQAEVVALSDKFGATSVQAAAAAEKAAELKDRIGDAKALTDAFNPDQKFRALTTSLAGVAGGFAAIQGGMALFGEESENVQKTLLKVQSAMALSEGLEAVGDSIDAFKNLGTVIRIQVVNAFSTLRGAIIATGVGALAVGLGLLIANFEKVKETLLNLFPGLAEFGNKVQNIVQTITDFAGITSQAARDAEALTKGINAYIKSLDNSIKILESQGGKEDEIYKAKRDRIEKQLSLIKSSSDEELQKRADLNAELTILDNNEANRIKKNNETAQKEKEERDNKRQEDRLKEQQRNDASIKANQEFELKIQQDLLKLDEENAAKKRAIEFQKNEDLISDLDYRNGLLDIDFEDDQQRLAIKEAYLLEQKNIELSNLELSELERIEIISKYSKMERDIDKDITASKKAEQEARINLQLQYIGFAEQAGNLLGQIAGKSKAVAIAGLLIEKGAAIAKIITQMMTVPAILPPGIPNPAFVPARIGGALSLASVIAASAQGISSINSAAAGGGSGGGIPAISTQSPMIPQIPTAQVTQLNQQSINDIGNQAVRAYVIESDVTSNQQRISIIRQRARFS